MVKELTKNQALVRWVDEVVAQCRPTDVHRVWGRSEDDGCIFHRNETGF